MNRAANKYGSQAGLLKCTVVYKCDRCAFTSEKEWVEKANLAIEFVWIPNEPETPNETDPWYLGENDKEGE